MALEGIEAIVAVTTILGIRVLPIGYDFIVKVSHRHHDRWLLLSGSGPRGTASATLDGLATLDLSLGYVFSMIATAGTLVMTSLALAAGLLIWSFLALLAIELIGPRLLRRMGRPSRTTAALAYVAAVVVALQLLLFEYVLEFKIP